MLGGNNFEEIVTMTGTWEETCQAGVPVAVGERKAGVAEP